MTNNSEKIEMIFQQLVIYKAKSGKTYKTIAQEVGITENVMNKLTSKSRRMTETNLDKLATYLSERE